jgi:hypothetical protein
MDIALDKVCALIERAREFDVKEGLTDPNSDSNPIDDGSTDVLTADPDDSTEEQIREFIAGLNEDERHELVALVWVGRGDYEADEWPNAVRAAQERQTTARQSTGAYLLGIPNLPDLLGEGLAALGLNCAD